MLLAFVATVVCGLVLLVTGCNARHALPVELRAHTGLTRIPIGILMISVPIGAGLYKLVEALGSLGTV